MLALVYQPWVSLNQGVVKKVTQSVAAMKWSVLGPCTASCTELPPARGCNARAQVGVLRTRWGEGPCGFALGFSTSGLWLAHLSRKRFTLMGSGCQFGGVGRGCGVRRGRGLLKSVRGDLGVPVEAPRAVRSSDPGSGLEQRPRWVP